MKVATPDAAYTSLMIRWGFLFSAVFAAGLLGASAVAIGQEAEPSEPASIELRPAWIASREVQEQDIAGVLEETTFWVQAGKRRFLVVSRPPSGETARGTLCSSSLTSRLCQMGTREVPT